MRNFLSSPVKITIVGLLLLFIIGLPITVYIIQHRQSPISKASVSISGKAEGGVADGQAFAQTTGCNTKGFLGILNLRSTDSSGWTLTGTPGDVGGSSISTANVVCDSQQASSVATISNFQLSIQGLVIHADYAESHASSTCGSSTPGSVLITGLTINGTAAPANTSPNQVVQLPNNGGTIIMNEQIAGPTSITVNAIHVHSALNKDFIFASSQAESPSCSVSPIPTTSSAPSMTPIPSPTIIIPGAPTSTPIPTIPGAPTPTPTIPGTPSETPTMTLTPTQLPSGVPSSTPTGVQNNTPTPTQTTSNSPTSTPSLLASNNSGPTPTPLQSLPPTGFSGSILNATVIGSAISIMGLVLVVFLW